MRGSLVLLPPQACLVAEHAAIGHSTGGGVEIRLTFWTSSYRFLYSSSFMFCASDVASALFLAVSHLQSQRGVRATLLWNGIAYSAGTGLENSPVIGLRKLHMQLLDLSLALSRRLGRTIQLCLHLRCVRRPVLRLRHALRQLPNLQHANKLSFVSGCVPAMSAPYRVPRREGSRYQQASNQTQLALVDALEPPLLPAHLGIPLCVRNRTCSAK